MARSYSADARRAIEERRRDRRRAASADLHHAEGPQRPVVLAHRDVLAFLEDVRFELVAGLVVLGIALDVVVKGPAAAAGMAQMAGLLGLAFPKAGYRAVLAGLTPGLRVDVTLRRQVSTEWRRVRAFFAGMSEEARGDGFVAILEVCGFNDWLIIIFMSCKTSGVSIKVRSSRD